MKRFEYLNSCMKSTMPSQCKRKFRAMTQWQPVNKLGVDSFN